MPLYAGSSSLIAYASIAAVERFGYHEFSVTNTNSYTNAYDYTEIELQATVTPPVGSNFTVYGFYDGGTTWKARIRADQAGAYSYTTAWGGTGTDGPTPSGNFTCVDNSLYRGPLSVATDRTWFFQDGRGVAFNARVYGTFHMIFWTSSRNIITEKELMKTRITSYLTNRGYNMTQFNGIGGAVWVNTDGARPFTDMPMTWWGAASLGTPPSDLDRYSVSAFAAFDELLLHFRAAGIYTFMLETLFAQTAEVSATRIDKLQRYMMARWGAMFNVFGMGGCVEWQDIFTTTEVNTIAGNWQTIDPYGRPLSWHDTSYSGFTGWLDFSMQQSNWVTYGARTVLAANDRRHGGQGFADGSGSGGIGNPFINQPIVASEWFWMSNNHSFTDWNVPRNASEMMRGCWGAMLAGLIPVPDWWNGYQMEYLTGSTLPDLLDVGEDRIRKMYDFLYGTAGFYREYIQLNSLVSGPGNEICSGKPGSEYLCYGDAGGTIALNLTAESSSVNFDVTWLNPATLASQAGTGVAGGASRNLVSPYSTSDSVALVKRSTAAFTPAAFPGITGWWSAKDSSSLPALGANLYTWNDKSGNARNFVEAAGSPSPAVPLYERNLGYLAAKCAGTPNYLKTSATHATCVGSTGLMLVVAELNGNPSRTAAGVFYDCNAIFHSEDAGNGGYMGIYCDTLSSQARWRVGIYDGTAKGLNFNATTGKRTIIMLYRDSGSVMHASIDGGTESTTSSVGAPTTQTLPMTIGAWPSANTQFNLNGWIYEAFTSTQNGTADERKELIQYMRGKWGIA